MNSVPERDAFRSILWLPADADNACDDRVAPDCFHDLNLDQVVEAIAKAWPDDDLAPFFHVPLHSVGAVGYRQAILRDFERAELRQAVETFVKRLRDMRARLTGLVDLHYAYEKERAFLGAAGVYCTAVQTLMQELGQLEPASAGLHAVHACLTTYATSAVFLKLANDTRKLLSAMDEIRYGLLIRSSSITVRPIEDEADASCEVDATFAKFRRDSTQGHRAKTHGSIGVNSLNHVEAQVLEKVASLHPQTFTALDAFCDEHEHFVDAIIKRFAREVCFYLAWIRFIEPLQRTGLPFCHPTVDTESKSVACDGGFDLALSMKLVTEREPVVRNGFALRDLERTIVVSGPNHGGKTTFARMFGQLHWLAALGLSVPGTHAQMFLFDHLFTHFEKEESVETLRGKLQDDLVRIHHILERATPRSVIVLNEIFASTTLEDAVRLGQRIMARLSDLDALSVCVTFLTELASYDEKTVSMVAAIDPSEPAIRTFKIECRPADGLAYALAIANKYRVTHAALLQRITP